MTAISRPHDQGDDTAGWFADDAEATPIFEQLLAEITTTRPARPAEEIIADATGGGPAGEDTAGEDAAGIAPASDGSGSDKGLRRAAIP